MTYTAIDNSRSVIQHYGKKGMKWRKNRADIEGRELQPAQWKARANKVNKMSSLTTKPQI